MSHFGHKRWYYARKKITWEYYRSFVRPGSDNLGTLQQVRRRGALRQGQLVVIRMLVVQVTIIFRLVGATGAAIWTACLESEACTNCAVSTVEGAVA